MYVCDQKVETKLSMRTKKATVEERKGKTSWRTWSLYNIYLSENVLIQHSAKCA